MADGMGEHIIKDKDSESTPGLVHFIYWCGKRECNVAVRSGEGPSGKPRPSCPECVKAKDASD